MKLGDFEMRTAMMSAILAAILFGTVMADRANDVWRVSAAIALHFNSDCLHIVLGSAGLERDRNIVTAKKFYSETGMFSGAVRAASLSPLAAGCVRPAYLLDNIADVKTYFERMSKDFDTPPAAWIVFLEETTDLESHFDDFNVPFDCEFLVARNDGELIRLVVTYRVAPHEKLRHRDFGAWNRSSGSLRVREDKDRWRNLEGITLKMVDIVAPPYTTIRHNDNEVGGFNGDIWAVLSHHMNFARAYTFPPDRKWGSRLSNGSWEGLIGAVVRGEADVASSGLAMTPERSPVVRFTLPHYSSTTRIYARRPAKQASLRALATPFHPTLWAALLASVATSSVAGVVAQALTPGDRRSLSDQVFFNFAAVFCGQGCEPRGIVGTLANLLGVVVLGGYSGSLMSSLTVVYIPRLPFTSLDDFQSDGSYSLGMINGTALHTAFREATGGKKKELFERVVSRRLPTSVDEGFRRVCGERDFAFLHIKESMGAETRLDCDVISLPQDAQRFCVGYALRPHLAYARAIDRAVLAMRNGGIMRKIYENDLVGRPRTPEKRGPQTVGFDIVVPVLMVWASGVALALILLVLEIVAFNFV